MRLLAYAAVLWPRLANGGRLAQALANAGRLSLTHYLTQSVTTMVIFYGCGFGLWGHVGVYSAAAIAIGLVAVQIALSGAWLRRLGPGPGERLLRRLSASRQSPTPEAMPASPSRSAAERPAG